MRSLSPQQRDELEQLMSQAMGDGELGRQMSQLTDNLRALRPGLPWDRGQQVRGSQPLGYGEAAAALGEIGELDELIDALGQEHPGATLDDIDVESVERTLGRPAADELSRIRELERELRRQGWVNRGADGLTLSPKALRRLGNTALRRVFDTLHGPRQGQHDLRDAGSAGEITGASRQWEFGDEQPLDVVRTVTRAVARGAGVPVELAVSDFEVVETERRASAAVALCVDLSFSMVWEGRWGPMKQTALALSHLVATRFPQDALQIIGFARTACGALRGGTGRGRAGLGQGHEPAARAAAGRPSSAQASWVRAGDHGGHRRRADVAHRRRRRGVFRLAAGVRDDQGDGPRGRPADPLRGHPQRVHARARMPVCARFVDAVARRNGGRVFTPDADDLGAYVVSDYLRARRGRRGAA